MPRPMLPLAPVTRTVSPARLNPSLFMRCPDTSNCAIVHQMGRNEKPERYTSERCWISEIINDPHWPEFSIARCRVEPGVTTELHALSVHEVYVIERGHGLMRVGSDAPYEVGPGDTVTIPRTVAQSISNAADSDLVFTCVCSPRFSQKCYTSLE